MKRQLLILVIGLMGIFLFSSVYSKTHKSESTYGEKSKTEMSQESDVQKVSETKMKECPYSQNLQSPEKLNGTKVVDANGENIGEVSGMLVDTKRGRISYVMLRSDGEKYPIPWMAMQQREDKKGFQVNLTAKELKNAPKGAQITSKDQEQKIHEFYGVSPKWEQGEMERQMKKGKEYYEKEGQMYHKEHKKLHKSKTPGPGE